MAALEMLIGGTCILTSASVHVNTMNASKISGQQKLHKYDQYIYTDNSQLIKGGQFKLGPHQVSLDKLCSPLKSKGWANLSGFTT